MPLSQAEEADRKERIRGALLHSLGDSEQLFLERALERDVTGWFVYTLLEVAVIITDRVDDKPMQSSFGFLGLCSKGLFIPACDGTGMWRFSPIVFIMAGIPVNPDAA